MNSIEQQRADRAIIGQEFEQLLDRLVDEYDIDRGLIIGSITNDLFRFWVATNGSFELTQLQMTGVVNRLFAGGQRVEYEELGVPIQ